MIQNKSTVPGTLLVAGFIALPLVPVAATILGVGYFVYAMWGRKKP